MRQRLWHSKGFPAALQGVGAGRGAGQGVQQQQQPALLNGRLDCS